MARKTTPPTYYFNHYLIACPNTKLYSIFSIMTTCNHIKYSNDTLNTFYVIISHNFFQHFNSFIYKWPHYTLLPLKSLQKPSDSFHQPSFFIFTNLSFKYITESEHDLVYKLRWIFIEWFTNGFKCLYKFFTINLTHKNEESISKRGSRWH